MSRIVSVWLPRWPIQRFLAAQAMKPQAETSCKPVDPERPFVLAVAGAGGPRIAALNEAAEAAGLAVGEPLADARAKADFLQVRAAMPPPTMPRCAGWRSGRRATRRPLRPVGDGARTTAPTVFFLDIEGASHLFGGEENLIADLAARLRRFGLAGAACGGRHAGRRLGGLALSSIAVAGSALGPGSRGAVADCRSRRLRLSPETRTALRRLGFKTVGALIDKPRAPFAARFAAELLRRLDQALGRVDEPLVPIVAPPVYHSLQLSHRADRARRRPSSRSPAG